ncbi:MAG: hypothetical protein IJ858_07390 [Acidaminococcaceae bacterium]|nr:hypothetical protein [Acidaminococcaceae bacterium]
MKSKKIRRKEPGSRICITLPAVLLEFYRQTAQETGLSVSRVILTVLKANRKQVLLLPRFYMAELKVLELKIGAALASNTVTPELKAELLTISEYLDRTKVFRS